MAGKDANGHNWQGVRCIDCGINAWTEASMWPCEGMTVVCTGGWEGSTFHEPRILKQGGKMISHSMCPECAAAANAAMDARKATR